MSPRCTKRLADVDAVAPDEVRRRKFSRRRTSHCWGRRGTEKTALNLSVQSRQSRPDAVLDRQPRLQREVQFISSALDAPSADVTTSTSGVTLGRGRHPQIDPGRHIRVHRRRTVSVGSERFRAHPPVVSALLRTKSPGGPATAAGERQNAAKAPWSDVPSADFSSVASGATQVPSDASSARTQTCLNVNVTPRTHTSSRSPSAPRRFDLLTRAPPSRHPPADASE